jgi:hypothetical protein
MTLQRSSDMDLASESEPETNSQEQEQVQMDGSPSLSPSPSVMNADIDEAVEADAVVTGSCGEIVNEPKLPPFGVDACMVSYDRARPGYATFSLHVYLDTEQWTMLDLWRTSQKTAL